VLCVCDAVTVAEHTSICTVYDFTMHPVSVHLPLTRLLASLYILLDEPVEVGLQCDVGILLLLLMAVMMMMMMCLIIAVVTALIAVAVTVVSAVALHYITLQIFQVT